MKTLAKRLGITLALAFVAIQFFRPSRTNPPTDPGRTIQARMQVTPAAAAVLERSCRDCHSHETRWPWYSEVAPTSWFVAGHVNHARGRMNLSDWAQYDASEAADKMGDICREVRKGGMPIPSYLTLHRDARLSAQDVTALCDWALAAKKQLQQQGAAKEKDDDEEKESSERH